MPAITVGIFYHYNDQLGTPNELTNKKGEVVWLANHYAWGERGNSEALLRPETRKSKDLVSLPCRKMERKGNARREL